MKAFVFDCLHPGGVPNLLNKTELKNCPAFCISLKIYILPAQNFENFKFKFQVF